MRCRPRPKPSPLAFALLVIGHWIALARLGSFFSDPGRSASHRELVGEESPASLLPQQPRPALFVLPSVSNRVASIRLKAAAGAPTPPPGTGARNNGSLAATPRLLRPAAGRRCRSKLQGRAICLGFGLLWAERSVAPLQGHFCTCRSTQGVEFFYTRGPWIERSGVGLSLEANETNKTRKASRCSRGAGISHQLPTNPSPPPSKVLIVFNISLMRLSLTRSRDLPVNSICQRMSALLATL